MEIRYEQKALELSELDPFLAELLRQIPESGDPDGSAEAAKRLFTLPADARETELCDEWKLYVEPELRRIFQTAGETVKADLAQLQGAAKPFANCALKIPNDHADAWLNVLNQARLVTAAKFGFTEGELSDHYRSPIGSRRDLALFQVNFYGFLQECILHEMQRGSPGAD